MWSPIPTGVIQNYAVVFLPLLQKPREMSTVEAGIGRHLFEMVVPRSFELHLYFKDDDSYKSMSVDEVQKYIDGL